MQQKLWISVTTLAFVGLLSGCGIGNSGSSGTTTTKGSSSTQWLTMDSSKKSVDLKLEADDGNAGGGMNFNGYSNGSMTVTVPNGWTVNVSFSNDNSFMPHSAMVVPYTDRSDPNFPSSSEAFQNASTPNPTNGITSGSTQHFTFKADKTGKYAIVCAVPGHAASGMWDTLVISDTATSASISTQ